MSVKTLKIISGKNKFGRVIEASNINGDPEKLKKVAEALDFWLNHAHPTKEENK